MEYPLLIFTVCMNGVCMDISCKELNYRMITTFWDSADTPLTYN